MRSLPEGTSIAPDPTDRRVLIIQVGLAVGVLLLLTWLRAPGVLTHGRFWAEEGRIFAALQDRSLLGRLFYLKDGQLQLLLNISLILAAHVPFVYAPLLTSYFGTLMTCCLVAVLVAFRRDLGIDLLSALLISVLVLTSPAAFENFANSTNVQWTASAIVVVLILLPGEVLRAHVGWTLALVALLGLSGVPASSLAPVAGLYAIARRSRVHGLVAVVLTVCAAIELTLLMGHELRGRMRPTDPYLYVMASFLQLIVKHLLGVEAAGALGDALRNGTATTLTTRAFLVLPTTLLLAAAFFIRRQWRHPLSLALLAMGYVVGVNVFGSTGAPRGLIGVWGMRYFFLPSIIGMIAVAMLLSRYRVVMRLSMSALVLAIVTVVATTDFFVHPYFNGMASDRPFWRAELTKCPSPPARCRLAISPPGWFIEMRVPPRSRD